MNNLSKKLSKISLSFVVASIGLIIMVFGASLSNLSLTRIGILLVTVGGWLIAWS